MKKLMIINLMLVSFALNAQNKIDSLTARLKTEPKNITVLTELAIAYHDLGVDGNKNAVKKGLEYIEKVRGLDSTQALALAYHGSLMTLKARDASMPWNKLKYTKEGFLLLDRAIALEPENLEARLVRAMNSYQVPEFMGRLETAISDFKFILAQPAFATWPAESKAYAHFYLGESLRKNGKNVEAREQYEQAVAIAPASESGRQARNKLKK